MSAGGHRTRANKPENEEANDDARRTRHDGRAARSSLRHRGGRRGVHRCVKPALRRETRQVSFCAQSWLGRTFGPFKQGNLLWKCGSTSSSASAPHTAKSSAKLVICADFLGAFSFRNVTEFELPVRETPYALKHEKRTNQPDPRCRRTAFRGVYSSFFGSSRSSSSQENSSARGVSTGFGGRMLNQAVARPRRTT